MEVVAVAVVVQVDRITVAVGVPMQDIISHRSSNRREHRRGITIMAVLRMFRVHTRDTGARAVVEVVVVTRAMTGHGLTMPGPGDQRVTEMGLIRRWEGEFDW